MARLRLAVRGLIVRDGLLLLVNAYPGGVSDLWCAPGGGVEPHASLPDNLIREVQEETGLAVEVGALVLVNEFHDRGHGFHQVEMIFRCRAVGEMPAVWRDPEGIVTERAWVTEAQARGLRVKPSSLVDAAFGRGAFADGGGAGYDPLERVVQ
jgi:ADP-ribose pyrophosphatase YjhB (NUDIX family)